MLRRFYETWISPQRWLDRVGIRAPMQIVIGLVLLMSCVLMFASALQLVPSDEQASVRTRMLLAEMASSRVASDVAMGDEAGARQFLESIVRRYAYVESAGLRRLNGSIVLETPGHEKYWAATRSNVNTPTHVQVQLYENQRPWGFLEIAFQPLEAPVTWRTWWHVPRVRMMIFIIASCYLFFWLFLSRMLRMLDPSSAVPERMQLMMDTLVEGMVILDIEGRIVMVNQAFARTAFSPVEKLIGKALSSLPWLANNGLQSPEVYPWQAVQQSDLPQRGVPIRLQVGPRQSRPLNVNASPILDTGGERRGVLVTFADQTAVESDNLQLADFVAKFGEASDEIHQLRETLKSQADLDHLAKLEELANTAREIAGICRSDAQSSALAAASSADPPMERSTISAAP